MDPSTASPTLQQYIVTESSPLTPDVLQQIANAGTLDEIPNADGSVRHHIYHLRDHGKDGFMKHAATFFIYQTTRHGPQNGFRFCLVNPGYYLASPTKADTDEEDDIDRLEKVIPQGYMEVAILGTPPPPCPDYFSDVDYDSQSDNSEAGSRNFIVALPEEEAFSEDVKEGYHAEKAEDARLENACGHTVAEDAEGNRGGSAEKMVGISRVDGIDGPSTTMTDGSTQTATPDGDSCAENIDDPTTTGTDANAPAANTDGNSRAGDIDDPSTTTTDGNTQTANSDGDSYA
ncbi:hypothetical protein F5B20DRAFT_52989 [Whalleya microplaca]|nr:hypothetical protein F5B20DRAFT_52989 [Whalleya microplaca]